MARAQLLRELEKNVKRPDRRSPYRYTRPAPKFDAIYLWDSAFISQIWRHIDVSVAEDSIRSVLHHQQKDGRVPLSIDILGTNKASQPPLLSWAVSRILASGGSLEFAREVAPGLKKFHSWYLSHRRTKSGLFFWVDTFESGMDNSPRFSNRDNSRNKKVRMIEAIDLASYMVMDAEALVAINKFLILGSQSPEEVLQLEKENAELEFEKRKIAKLIRERHWNSKEGMYADRDLETDEVTRSFSIASFLPLTAGIATDEEAEILLKDLRDPEKFNTPIPFPSHSASSKEFELDMWRGPVWVNMAYLVIQGLHRYQESRLAREMSYRLVHGVYETWYDHGHFYEYYDPFETNIRRLTRKKGEGWFEYFSGSNNVGEILEHFITKRVFLGNKPVKDFVGWTGLVHSLEIEEGLTPKE